MAVYRPDPVTFRRQIDSLRAQGLREWRCEIAIDGGEAADLATVERCTEGDDRFRIVNYVDRVGFYRNFERALEQVDYEVDWIALADQDDHWYPQKLETLVPLLHGRTLVTGQARVVSEGRTGTSELGPTRRRWPGLFADLLDNAVTGSFCVFTPAVAREALPFPAPTHVAYHDHWIGACAASLGPVHIIEDALQDYIQHDRNVVGEATRGRWLARLLDWRTRAGGSFSVAYLADQRWGWRVTMARTILERIDVAPAVRADVSPFASGRISAELIGRSIRAIWRRDAPAARVAAILVGAAVAPRSNVHIEASVRRAHDG